ITATATTKNCFHSPTHEQLVSSPTYEQLVSFPTYKLKTPWSQKLWLSIVTTLPQPLPLPPYYKTHGFRQRNDLRRARTFPRYPCSQARKKPQTRKKAQDQDNSSTQQTT